jgi:hypothetical protein
MLNKAPVTDRATALAMTVDLYPESDAVNVISLAKMHLPLLTV